MVLYNLEGIIIIKQNISNLHCCLNIIGNQSVFVVYFTIMVFLIINRVIHIYTKLPKLLNIAEYLCLYFSIVFLFSSCLLLKF